MRLQVVSDEPVWFEWKLIPEGLFRDWNSIIQHRLSLPSRGRGLLKNAPYFTFLLCSGHLICLSVSHNLMAFHRFASIISATCE